MKNSKRTTALALALLLLTVTIAAFQTPLVLADEKASIETANLSINQAFTSVLAAEKAGANVTPLLTELNTAGELLAEAQNAYSSGNLSNVASKAENARIIADQVNSDALTLRDVSLVESQNNFWLTLTFSVVGAVVFGIALLLVWRRFKRGYMKKLLSLKPEVVDNET